MIYQELLDFLASNYLNREEAFGLLNQAVLDLADKNLGYLQAMIAVFGILITIIVSLAIYTRWESKKDFKEYEKRLDEYEKSLEEQKSVLYEASQDSKSKFELNEKNLKDLGERLKKDLLRQAVDSQYKLYLSMKEQGKHDFTFFSYIGYLIGEHEYYKKYNSFALSSSFNNFLIELRNILSFFKSGDVSFQDDMNTLLQEIFEKFKKFPEFKESSLEVIEEANKLLKQTQIKFKKDKDQLESDDL